MKMLRVALFASIFLHIWLAACTGPGNKEATQQLEEAKTSMRYDQLLSDKLSSFQPLPALADNPNNPSTDVKVKLGQMLYFDTRLSLNGNNSCNSCHNLATYGVDNLPTSPGDLGKTGDRNSPTTLNAALHSKQFWDGRAHDVEEQAGGPVLNPVEMNIPSESFLVTRLKAVPEYQNLFAEAFPASQEPITYENMQKAIGAFERKLLTPSRFDDYLKGNKNALSVSEKKGLLSFVLIGCTTCHSGALLGGNQFQRFGVYQDYWDATGSEHIDKGLGALTGDAMDDFIFKVPSLRNVTMTAPYFHDGSVADLKESIKIMAAVQLDYKVNKEELQKGELPEAYKINPFEAKEI